MSTAVMDAITIMWQGMAGVLVVMGVLSAIVACLAKAGNKKN